MTSSDTILAYLRAIESADLDAVDQFFHPEVVVTEHPNKLVPAGKSYDRAEIRAAAERGKALLASQRYEVRGLIADGDRVCAQTAWTGVTRTGVELRAHICSIFELRDGETTGQKVIWRQEQYDCFL